jgi:hypothetical protein
VKGDILRPSRGEAVFDLSDKSLRETYRIEATLIREAGVSRSAFTPAYSGGGKTAHRCDSALLSVGRELPEPTPEAKAKSDASYADALRLVPLGHGPRVRSL